MSKKNNIIAFIVIGALGTLMHFVYEWSGENPIVGVFAPINESIWEHQKLLFFPALVYFAAEYFSFGKRIQNYIAASALGIFSGIAFIITVFYLYSGILGYSVDAVNILLFFAGVLVTLIIRNIIIKNRIMQSPKANCVSLIALAAVALLFGIWTFYPPKISLFIPDLS